jgi:hypothetical protein
MFLFGSFKSPSVQIEKDSTVDRQAEEEAVFFERMHLLESGLQLFDSLFAAFLHTRLGDTWQSTLGKINDWLEEES